MATIRKSKGRAPRPPAGERLTRSQLARRLRSSGRTIASYLSDYPDAPKPDADHRYSLAEVKAHIEKHSARLGNTAAMLRLRERLLELRVAEGERLEAIEQGRVVAVDKIAPAIAAFCSKLTTDMQDVFERELPSKCHGRSTPEIAELMGGAVDRVLRALKDGTAVLTGPAT